MTTVTAVPTMRKRRRYMMDSVVYHAGSVPHLLDPIQRAVVVPHGTPKKTVDRKTKAALKAARRDEP